jgi:hypothetical protein
MHSTVEQCRAHERGKYNVYVVIEEPNLAKAYLELPNGTETPLALTAGRYFANISTTSDLRFTIKAVDASRAHESI